MRRLRFLAGALFLAAACPAHADVAGAPASPWLDDFTVASTETPAAPLGSWVLAQAQEQDQVGTGRMARKPKKEKREEAKDTTAAEPHDSRVGPALTSERARILLQSLTVPGWGQATVGRKTAATVFGLIEAGIWASFAAFRVQEHLRRLTYEQTAAIYAGIDLEGRDEEYRRIVGSFPSSQDYNELVVYRDAANQFMRPGHEDPAAYRAYIEANAVKGDDAWSWESEEAYARYQNERKDTTRAGKRANAALAVAMANRLVSAIHAARIAKPRAPGASSWNIECAPAGGGDPTAFHLGVRTRF